jgi:hypothetical protein
MGMVNEMQNRAKKIWLTGVELITISFLLVFHVSVIIILAALVVPFILWKWIKGGE